MAVALLSPEDEARDARPIFLRVKSSFAPRGQTSHDGHQIAWGFRITRSDGGDGLSRVQVSAWALSPDAGQPASAISFHDGAQTVHRCTPRGRRPDVIRALGLVAAGDSPVAQCGFSDQFDTRAARLEVRIALAGSEVTIGTLDLPAFEVVAGRDGWLFLAGDSNDSLGQHRHDFVPGARWLAGWDAYFAALDELPAARTVFLVAPSKESVMPERHPFPHRAHTPVMTLIERHPGRILYPLEALRAARDLAFDRVDTHWTDLGARIAAEEVLTRVGEALPAIPPLYAITEGHGDLGDKLAPPETALRPVAGWNSAARCVFDNRALHHGNIRILVNPQAPLDRVVVVFGGSSADAMTRYLAAACRRVVSIYGAGSWDPAIIAHEQPDIILLQTNERFLVTPPPPHADCIARAAAKIAAGHVTRAPAPGDTAPCPTGSGEDWYAAQHAALLHGRE